MHSKTLVIFSIYLFANISFAGPLSEAEFNQVIKEAEEFFAPIYLQNGKVFTIESDFSYNENNAKASAYSIDHYYIELYGGLVKHPTATKDSFRAAICHEVGHHFGGRPLVPKYYKEYFLFRGSSEGQADYWSAHTCLKKWLELEDHEKILRQGSFSFKDLKFCRNYFREENESLLCTRIITAFKNMFSVKIETKPFVHFLSPYKEQTIPLAASVIHPKKDCRMETIYAGVICPQGNEYGCLLSGNRPEASRPLCWVGLEEILEYEVPKLPRGEVRRIQKLLMKMNLKGFNYDFYEDEETKYLGQKLSKKHEQFIKNLNLGLTHK